MYDNYWFLIAAQMGRSFAANLSLLDTWEMHLILPHLISVQEKSIHCSYEKTRSREGHNLTTGRLILNPARNYMCFLRCIQTLKFLILAYHIVGDQQKGENFFISYHLLLTNTYSSSHLY